MDVCCQDLQFTSEIYCLKYMQTVYQMKIQMGYWGLYTLIDIVKKKFKQVKK